VRNQESKENIPSMLKHALCLTVYEAKGLEFDDVILFNFFNDSESQQGWRLINDLIVKKETIQVPKNTGH
jgi:ATP-dependent exoDNAse (exonuclease V) beta subunit